MSNMLVFVAACLLGQGTIYHSYSEPEESRISGRIVTREGVAVPGARVFLRCPARAEPRELGRATSGADGRFVFEIAKTPDDAQFTLDAFLEVDAAEFAPTRLDRVYVPPPAYDLGNVVVDRPVELHGTVVDRDGVPIAGARIHAALGPVDRPDPYRAMREPIATSNERGEFACRVLPPGRVTLGVSAERHADFELEKLQLERGTNEVHFVMGAARSVRVRVVDSQEAPLANASITPSVRGPSNSSCRPASASTFGFWRESVRTDERGVALIEGLPEDARANVTISALGMRPEWLQLAEAEHSVQLQRTIRLDVTAQRADGTPTTIYELKVRDGSGPRSWCGNCEDVNWLESYSDSSWVRVFSPSSWQVEWNTPDSYVRGSRPSIVSVRCDDGTSGELDLAPDIEPGSTVPCRVTIDAPGSISGRVVDADGNPLSLRLGLQIGFRRSDFFALTSKEDGRFEFDRTRRGYSWFHSLDQAWEIADDASVDWGDRESVSDVLLRATPRSKSGAGTVRVRVTIAGRVPVKPVLLALDDIGQDLPDAYPRALAWTDADGWIEVTTWWPRAYHLVPKRTAANCGGWRDFGGEFPTHGEKWPWKVDVPASGTTEVKIDFPVEAEWSRFAPEREN